MSNPLFNALGGGMPQGNGPMQMIQQFMQFKQNFKGRMEKRNLTRFIPLRTAVQIRLLQLPCQWSNWLNPFGHQQTPGSMTKKDIEAIKDPSERQAAIAQNIQLFQ